VSSLDPPLGPLSPRCATHPQEPASGTCSRCGTFVCAGCVRKISGKPWCAACAARPEINYLGRFRLKLWGRRDGPAWVAGALSLALAAATLLGLWERRPLWLLVLVTGACSAASLAFFLGRRRAREALIGTSLSCAVALWGYGFRGPAIVFLLGCFAAVLLSFDTRNRLFFRQPVSPERLQRLWHVRENNPRARDAMYLGIASAFFPLFAPLAILVGVVALRRVDPNAVPPIGRKGQAIAGVVLGTVMLGLWSLLLSRFFGGVGYGNE
jgi:hypothetical protein